LKDFIKSFFIYGLATFVDKFIALFFIPIYASYFPIDDFGRMEIIQSFTSIVSIFVFLQLETFLQRHFFEYDNARIKILISTLIFFVCILSLVVCIFSTFFSDYISSILLSDGESAGLIVMCSWQIPFIGLYTFSTIVLRFDKRYNSFVKLVLLSVILNISLPSYFVIYRKLGLDGFFISQLISIVILSIFSLYNIRKYLALVISKSELFHAFVYALPQFPARVGSVINTYANRFFINIYLDTYSLGLFSIAIKISSVLQIIYQFFVTFWNQVLFEIKTKVNNKSILEVIFKLTNFSVFLIVSLLSLFSFEIVSLISQKFIASHVFIGYLSFAIALLLVKEVVDVGPKYEKKTIYLSLNFGLSILVNLVSLILFTPLYGLYGVCLSLILGNLFLLMSSWYFSWKLFPVAFCFKSFAICLLPCMVIFFVNDQYQLSGNWGLKIILSVLLVTFYGFHFFKSLNVMKVLYS